MARITDKTLAVDPGHKVCVCVYKKHFDPSFNIPSIGSYGAITQIAAMSVVSG